MPTERPKQRFEDIVENAESILAYTKGLDLHTFQRNRLVRDGTERCLERISEAAQKLGPAAEAHLPQYPWRQIRDLGNILRHAYDNVDADIVWDIVTTRLPSLIVDAAAVARLLPDDPGT